jgi:hypothetical protein
VVIIITTTPAFSEPHLEVLEGDEELNLQEVVVEDKVISEEAKVQK